MHPARSDDRSDDDRLHDVRVLMPLLQGLPNPAGLAAGLLDAFGSLARVVLASPGRLAAFDPAVGGVAHRFRDLAALHAALLRAELETRPLAGGDAFAGAAFARRFVAARIGNRDRETLGALVLTTRLHLLADAVLADGTVDRTAGYVREIARLVFAYPAAGVILYHNHPSGDPTPSRLDWTLTDAARDALHALDASLFDHIVCAGAATVSLAQLQPDRFDGGPSPTRYTADR